MINNISMHFCMSFLPFSLGLFHYVVPVPLWFFVMILANQYSAPAERLLCSSLLAYWFFVMILASFVPVPRFSVRHPQILKGTIHPRSIAAERLIASLTFACPINVPRHAAPESRSLRSVISRGSNRSANNNTSFKITTSLSLLWMNTKTNIPERLQTGQNYLFYVLLGA